MAYNFIVLPDPEEGYEISPTCIEFVMDRNRLERAIRNISSKNPQASICVYSLDEINKLKTQPEYQKYKVSNGEVLPV